MKFREIFRFEFKYQLRHVSTWIYAAIPLLFPLVLSQISQSTDDQIYLNAPSFIIFVTVTSGIFWLLTAGAIAGHAATRDVYTLQHPLTYTAPISKLEYLGGRFIAAFALNTLIQLAVPLAFLAALHIPGGPSGILGPFRPEAYLTIFFYFALPNTLFVTACQFSVAVLDRRAIGGYIGSILIFPIISHFIAMAIAKASGNWELWRLIDLAGISLAASTDTWTVVEKNTRLISLEGLLLWNRLLWLSITVALVTYTYFRFRFTHQVAKNFRFQISIPIAIGIRFLRPREFHSTPPEISGPKSEIVNRRSEIKPTFNITTYLSQAGAIARSSFRMIAKSKLGLTVVGLFALHLVVFASQYLMFREVPQYPKTMNLITLLIAPLSGGLRSLIIIPLLIVYFAGELVWRERDGGLNRISDPVPVPEWVFLLGKFWGLGLVIMVWLFFLMMAGILHQAFIGYTHFEVGVYVKALFGFQLADYLLFAMLALAVHVIVNQKYVGHLVMVIVFLYVAAHARLGIEHNLLIYSADPGWSYTDMRGFGPYLWPWISFKLYWAGWALLLAVAARLLWVRSMAEDFRMRLKLARLRFTRTTASVTVVSAGLILCAGGYIFYNTNIRNDYTSARDRTERHARYELTYGKYKDVPQPQLKGTKLHVELYPSQRKAEIRGTCNLINQHDVPLDSIHLSTVWSAETGMVTFDRPSSLVLDDKDLGYRIYTLHKPLQPGDSLTLSFEVKLLSRGFTNRGYAAPVIGNGTYFVNHDWAPAVGYQSDRELRDAGIRKKHGLAPKILFASLYDTATRQTVADKVMSHFEAVVGTEHGQVAIATGALLRKWTTKDQRNYFHYATSAPIGDMYSFYSANYAVREEKWNAQDSVPSHGHPSQGSGVTIMIYYHPGHAENIDRIVRSVKTSLSYFTREFGPYPYSHLTIVERSGYEGQLNAEATTVDYGESFTLANHEDHPKALDITYFAMAHEVSHQWWGAAQLSPARVEGSILLAETLANYSGLKVMEETYGNDQVRLLLAMWRTSYEVPRARFTPPLLQATDAFLGYRKGPLALYALTQYAGKTCVSDALRQLLSKHTAPKDPLPTSLDLYRELQAVTPDSLHYLLRDYFEKNIYWQLKTEQATARQIDSATWQVTLKVQAQKVLVDSTGAEISLPMNDWIEVGVFAPWEEGETSGKTLHLRKYRIHAGEQTITVTVPRKPGRAGIDPNYLLIDLDLDNNTRRVTIEGVKETEPDLI